MPNREEPKQGLFRMVPSGLARADTANDGNTLVGYAAVFDTWTDIEGYSGTFREKIDPKAFNRTIANNRDQIKTLYNHGTDPSLGSKPLGKVSVLRTDHYGLWTETPLSAARSVQEEIKPRLQEGSLDGMSFMFDVTAEEWDNDATPPERTIREVKLYEFGPVTWPAYESTSAGIRSKGVYGVPEPAAPSKSARQEALDADARDTSAQEALEEAMRQVRMSKALRAFQEKHGTEVETSDS